MSIKNVIAKAKEKAINTKKKLIEADKKHPWLKYAVIVCGGYAIYRIGFHKGCNETAKAEIDFLKSEYPDAYDIVVGKKTFENREFAKRITDTVAEEAFAKGGTQWDAYKRNWTENYRDNFEKLAEFAKGLDLKHCECLSVGYYVDPNSEKDIFHKYIRQQCGNSGYIQTVLD